MRDSLNGSVHIFNLLLFFLDIWTRLLCLQGHRTSINQALKKIREHLTEVGPASNNLEQTLVVQIRAQHGGLHNEISCREDRSLGRISEMLSLGSGFCHRGLGTQHRDCLECLAFCTMTNGRVKRSSNPPDSSTLTSSSNRMDTSKVNSSLTCSNSFTAPTAFGPSVTHQSSPSCSSTFVDSPSGLTVAVRWTTQILSLLYMTDVPLGGQNIMMFILHVFM